MDRMSAGGIFSELCGIGSNSLEEADVARVVRRQLDALSIDWDEDDAGSAIGGNCGNTFARIPDRDGNHKGAVMLCAHLDTVPPVGNPQPQLVDGVWSNGADGILGADNKAAVTAILAAASHWSDEPPVVPIEILFTVAEECSLLGAKHFDLGKSQAKVAFVFDHPTPIGTLVSSSPTHYSIVADFIGTAAHAGVAPLDGRSAIRAAALAISSSPHAAPAENATANIGRIKGGTGVNVVAEHCRIEGEVRALDPSIATELVSQMTEACNQAANDVGCSVDITIERSFEGYVHSDEHLGLQVGKAALELLGVSPVGIFSAGGADVNVFEAAGVPSLNLGDGSLDTHTSHERIADSDLNRLVELAISLPEAARSVSRG